MEEYPMTPLADVPGAGLGGAGIGSGNIGTDSNTIQSGSTTKTRLEFYASTLEDGMWSLYLAEADKVDGARMENWKSDMDAILIFSGLFSAVIAAFIIESYQNLQQDPADVTILLLAQISMQLAANASASVPALSPAAIPFRPNKSMQAINTFWFLSLSLSLTCALLATLVQQWARQYLQVVRTLKGKKDRAALRAYVAQGHERYHARQLVKAMPALLHASLFLFLVGLAVFLYTINMIVASVAVLPTVLLLAIYIYITYLSTRDLDCPYQTPLSFFFWRSRHSIGVRAGPVGARVGSPEEGSEALKPEMARLREKEALDAFTKSQARARALAFVREGLVGREEYISFFKCLPKFLAAHDGWEVMHSTWKQWADVWLNFPLSDVGDDAEADLPWVRSVFATVAHNIVTSPKLLYLIWRSSKQLRHDKVDSCDFPFPQELQIFKAVRRIRDHTRKPLAARYAMLIEFMIAKQSRPMQDTWGADTVDLLTKDPKKPYTKWKARALPGTDEGIMLQDTLRFITSRAFITPFPEASPVPPPSDNSPPSEAPPQSSGASQRSTARLLPDGNTALSGAPQRPETPQPSSAPPTAAQTTLNYQMMIPAFESFVNEGYDGGSVIASIASKIFEENRIALLGEKFPNPRQHGGILTNSQRKKFLESVDKLLNSQTDNTSLTPLAHFYVFDIVREYNSKPEGPVQGGAEPDLQWITSLGELYENYVKEFRDNLKLNLKKKPGFIDPLEEHFDRLGSLFPYSHRNNTTKETEILAETMKRSQQDAGGRPVQVGSQGDETEPAPPRDTHPGPSNSAPGPSTPSPAALGPNDSMA
ncbi:hypothetical protein HWV62_43401 [Athelia sp. TMB]|nr:hypothetical protein HWV62_43401 [Athelia sp. TMB]